MLTLIQVLLTMKIFQNINQIQQVQTFQLRDCLDFRPRVDDASTINSGGQDRSFDGTGAFNSRCC